MDDEIITLPEYITDTLGIVVARQCQKIGHNNEITIRHYAEFAQDIAQEIHKAMIKHQMTINEQQG